MLVASTPAVPLPATGKSTGPTARTISPALETPSTPRGSGGLSFRANGGKVDLELRIRKEGVAPHVGSLLAIVAILAMIGLRAWRTRR